MTAPTPFAAGRETGVGRNGGWIVGVAAAPWTACRRAASLPVNPHDSAISRVEQMFACSMCGPAVPHASLPRVSIGVPWPMPRMS